MLDKNEKDNQQPAKLTYHSPRIVRLGSIEKIQSGRDGNSRDGSGGYYYA